MPEKGVGVGVGDTALNVRRARQAAGEMKKKVVKYQWDGETKQLSVSLVFLSLYRWHDSCFLWDTFFVRQFARDEDLHRQLRGRTMGVRRKEWKTKIPRVQRGFSYRLFFKIHQKPPLRIQRGCLQGLPLKSPLPLCWDKWYETVNCEAWESQAYLHHMGFWDTD